jgi:hypothetical protein
MTTVLHRAIAEHVASLVAPGGRPLKRLVDLPGAVGLDDRAKYMARRAVALRLGCPSHLWRGLSECL